MERILYVIGALLKFMIAGLLCGLIVVISVMTWLILPTKLVIALHVVGVAIIILMSICATSATSRALMLDTLLASNKTARYSQQTLLEVNSTQYPDDLSELFVPRWTWKKKDVSAISATSFNSGEPADNDIPGGLAVEIPRVIGGVEYVKVADGVKLNKSCIFEYARSTTNTCRRQLPEVLKNTALNRAVVTRKVCSIMEDHQLSLKDMDTIVPMVLRCFFIPRAVDVAAASAAAAPAVQEYFASANSLFKPSIVRRVFGLGNPSLQADCLIDRD